MAAELARIVYQVLTKQEDFNGTFRGVPLPRTKTRQWPRLATRPPNWVEAHAPRAIRLIGEPGGVPREVLSALASLADDGLDRNGPDRTGTSVFNRGS